MTSKTIKLCAILTMDSLEEFEVYDDLCDQPLLAQGWQTELVSWRKPQVNWQDYDAVIIRSPWDYQDDAQAFMQVIETIDASPAHLENSAAIVRWNIDKIYLQELAEHGVKIVPTLWQENLVASDVSGFFEALNVTQIVIKPRISANADNTFWLTKDNYQQSLVQLVEIFAQEAFLVQPFMDSIVTEGEFSLFYFDGQFSHCILKVPEQGDFRVQEEHGGSLQRVVPDSILQQHAGQVLHTLDTLHETPLYARLDFVRQDDAFALMEAELIEPSLYFNMDEDAPERFAKAFAHRMRNLTL